MVVLVGVVGVDVGVAVFVGTGCGACVVFVQKVCKPVFVCVVCQQRERGVCVHECIRVLCSRCVVCVCVCFSLCVCACTVREHSGQRHRLFAGDDCSGDCGCPADGDGPGTGDE